MVDLGYVDDPGEDMAKAMVNTEIELKYNLSKVYLSTGRSENALELLLQANTLKEEYRFQIRIVECYKRIKEFDKAFSMLEMIQSQDSDSKKTKSLLLAKADIYKAKGDFQEALRILIQLKDELGNVLSVLKSLGDCYISLKNWKEAKKIFKQCLIIDAHDASSYKALATCELNLKEYESAIESALTATELFYQFPTAHYVLAQALMGIGQYEMAARSFEVALTMRPSFTAAKIALEKLYKGHPIQRSDLFQEVLVERGDAKDIQSKLDSRVKKAAGAKSYKGRKLGEITIVSGLPRSGTSLMMQMLDAAGLAIYQDHVRKADDNNPKGFFEHENVKSLVKKNNWLKDARGKVVKIVSPLIRFLPPPYNYKIIVVKRDAVEVVQSQHKMLVKAGKADASSYPINMEDTLKKQFQSALEWMEKQPNVEFLIIDFKKAIAEPKAVAADVATFLKMDLDLEAMANSSVKELYRNRN